MKRLIQDLVLPVVVLLALPIGMLGPALTLPLLIYGFPFIMLAIFLGLLLLLRQEKGEKQVVDLPLQDLSGRPAAGGPEPGKFASAQLLERTRHKGSMPVGKPLGGGPFRRILVLLNPEDFAIRAVARVVATAKRDNAEVVLASVVSAEEAILKRDVRGSLTHQTQLIRLRLDKLLENVSWRLEECGVTTWRRSEIAEPSSQVPDLAREEEVDLVVLTPRAGRLRQVHAAMPDWAQAVPCPVLALAS